MMSVGEAISPLRSALEGAGVRYAVGGSWASTAFGEPRFTSGVDVLADFTGESLDRFLPHWRIPTRRPGTGSGSGSG